jgi:L-ascorbate metabolism protein UlaG (beta-lactamase superfamily)
MASVSYLSNPNLPIIKKGWKGNPVINGRFIDPNKRFDGSFSKVLKWKLNANEKEAEKKQDNWRVKVNDRSGFLDRKEDMIVWLGHASFFIQVDGIRIITDPVLYKLPLLSRFSGLPCSIDAFRNIDYVLLSHAHRDHCDIGSLRALYANSKFHLVTSLNTGKYVARFIPGLQYTEAGWYQQFKAKEAGLSLTFLPTQHWSNRFPWDTNQTLWGSFIIEGKHRTIYFGGDSAYCSYFSEVASLFPHIDYAMLGVGAYHPAFMMEDVHMNPQQAIQAFDDLGARHFIPMHYGTFDLADEPLGEPYRMIGGFRKNRKEEILLPDIGDVITI